MLGHSPLSALPLGTSTAPVSESHALISFFEISAGASPNGTAVLVGVQVASAAGTIVAVGGANGIASLTGAGVTSSAGAVTGSGGGVVLPSDPNLASVVLLLHGDGTNGGTSFIDSSPLHKSPTIGGASATTSTAQSKFGGSSISLSASSYLSYADSADWFVGTGPFTIEGWVRCPTDVTTAQRFWGQRDSTGATVSGEVSITSGNVGATSGANVPTNSTTFSPGVWYHIAYVGDASFETLYVNGVSTGNVSRSTGGNTDISAAFSLGRSGDYNANYFAGFIDEFRFTKGVARYSANFVPQDRPFVGDAGITVQSAVGVINATAGSNASVTLVGAATTSAVGTVTATGGGTKTLTGAPSTSGVGVITASGTGSNGTATLTGATTTTSAGAITATGGAQTALTGAGVASGIGALVSTGSGIAVLSGAPSTSAVGFIIPGVSVTLTGAATASGVGSVTATGNGNVTLSGASATSAAGSIAPTGSSPNGSVTLVGVQATSSAAALAPSGSATKAMPTVQVTSGFGLLTANGGAGAAIAGALITSNAGLMSAFGTAIATITGAQALAYAGIIIADGGESSPRDQARVYQVPIEVRGIKVSAEVRTIGIGPSTGISVPATGSYFIVDAESRVSHIAQESRIFIAPVESRATATSG